LDYAAEQAVLNQNSLLGWFLKRPFIYDIGMSSSFPWAFAIAAICCQSGTSSEGGGWVRLAAGSCR